MGRPQPTSVPLPSWGPCTPLRPEREQEQACGRIRLGLSAASGQGQRCGIPLACPGSGEVGTAEGRVGGK